MSRLTTSIQSVFAAFGVRVTRLRPANRFDAMSESLGRLARVGFMPTIDHRRGSEQRAVGGQGDTGISPGSAASHRAPDRVSSHASCVRLRARIR